MVARPRAGGGGIVLFVAAIIAAGVAVGFFVRLMPVEATQEARQIDQLFSAMLGIATTIFLLVEGMLVYSAFRFRRRKGDSDDGPPIHGSTRLEIAWTIVPALVAIWLGVYSYQILAVIQAPRPEALTVEVTARQFQWQFRYPENGVVSPHLHVPRGQAVRLRLRSEDVIHSFWVPAFRVKQDALPQRDLDVYFTAHTNGEYPVVCAELCGAGHARMGLTSVVIVEEQADFEVWIAQQAGAKPDDPRIELFNVAYGCNACHALQAARATGQIGPDLNGIGARAAARVEGLAAEEYIRQSILEPNAFIAPECPQGACAAGVMPQDFDTRMAPGDLDAIVSLLLEQQ